MRGRKKLNWSTSLDTISQCMFKPAAMLDEPEDNKVIVSSVFTHVLKQWNLPCPYEMTKKEVKLLSDIPNLSRYQLQRPILYHQAITLQLINSPSCGDNRKNGTVHAFIGERQKLNRFQIYSTSPETNSLFKSQ